MGHWCTTRSCIISRISDDAEDNYDDDTGGDDDVVDD